MRLAIAVLGAALGLSGSAAAEPSGAPILVDEAQALSHIGGRPAFSPDGKRIAFVDRTYGDAFEIDLATRKTRKLTGGIAHGGVVRIQYLANGDYLITAPRINIGPNTRAHLEMWVLNKTLDRPLQPLGSQVFEGIAVSTRRNLIAWAVIEPELARDEAWQTGFVRPVKHYIAEIDYAGGVPRMANKREILANKPEGCAFIEPQDFRDDDRELIYSCLGAPSGGAVSIWVGGMRLSDGRHTTYFRRVGTYAEVEGIAPDGSWATVECGDQSQGVLPPLDLCRLDLKPGGALTRLVADTAPGDARGVSNSVISPDGRWIAFQLSDSNDPDVGAGNGVYLARMGAR